MMIETITLDIGGAMPTTFNVPDASGLAPLALPESFFDGGNPHHHPSFDAVRRFEAAMGAPAAVEASVARVARDVAQTLDAPMRQGVDSAAGAGRPPYQGPVLERPAVEADAVARPLDVDGRMPSSESPTPMDGRAAVPAADAGHPSCQAPVLERPAVEADAVARPSDVDSRMPASESPTPMPGRAAVPVADAGHPPCQAPVLERPAVEADVAAQPSDVAGRMPASESTTPMPSRAAVPAAGADVKPSAEQPTQETIPLQQDNKTIGQQDTRAIGQQDTKKIEPQDNRIQGQQDGKTIGQLDSKTIERQDKRRIGETSSDSPPPILNSQFPIPNSQELQGVAPVAESDGGLSVSAVSARTEAIVDAVNEIVDAVVGQITITPSLVRGEGEVRMTLKPTVLDGSDITLTAKDGTLTVAVTPATPSAEQAMAAALPRLEIALAEHAPAFRHVEVALVAKKGRTDEVA